MRPCKLRKSCLQVLRGLPPGEPPWMLSLKPRWLRRLSHQRILKFTSVPWALPCLTSPHWHQRNVKLTSLPRRKIVVVWYASSHVFCTHVWLILFKFQQRRSVAASRFVPKAAQPAAVEIPSEEAASNADLASEALYRAEAEKDLDEEEELFNLEENIANPTSYNWEDKYRPRKPRYFNRVHTGYEWNKYNQTHYEWVYWLWLIIISDHFLARTTHPRRSSRGIRFVFAVWCFPLIFANFCWSSIYFIPISSTSQRRLRIKSSRSLATMKLSFCISAQGHLMKILRSESSIVNGNSHINGEYLI